MRSSGLIQIPDYGPPFRHSLRAICTVLLDPRDPLLHSERTQGFAADPDYWKGEVFAYVGSIQNLKDLKDLCFWYWELEEPKGPRGVAAFSAVLST